MALTVTWESDWTVRDHGMEYGTGIYPEEPKRCLQATIRGSDGTCLASLGCIDDPSDEYMAEVESELLAEVEARAEANIIRGEN